MNIKNVVAFTVIVSMAVMTENAHAMNVRRPEGLVFNFLKRGIPPLNLGSMQSQISASQGLTFPRSFPKNQYRTFTGDSRQTWSKGNGWSRFLVPAAGVTALGTIAGLIYYYQAQEYVKELDASIRGEIPSYGILTAQEIVTILEALRSKYPLLTVGQVVSIMRQLKVNFSIKDYQTGATPLHYCVKGLDKDSVFCTQVLLELGANKEALDKQKRKPLECLNKAYTDHLGTIFADADDEEHDFAPELAPIDKTYEQLKNLLNLKTKS